MANYCGLTGCLLSSNNNNNSSNQPSVKPQPTSNTTTTNNDNNNDSNNNRVIFPVPLKDVAIYTEVRGFSMAITASLTYENMLNETIECQLVLPIDDTACMAIYRLEADFDGMKIRGECRSRETAIEVYSTAFDNSYNGVLLEGSQTPSANAVHLWLGHLKPQGVVVVTLGIVQMIGREPVGGVYSITIPSVLNPRYVPDFDENVLTSSVEEIADLKNRLNFANDCAYIAVTGCAYSIGFEAKINLGIGNRVSGVTASTSSDELSVRYTDDNRFAIVTLAGPFSADHDLELLVTPAETNKPMVYFEPGTLSKGEGSTCKWLTFHSTGAWFEPQGQTDYNGEMFLTNHQNSTRQIARPTNGVKHCRDSYWLVVDRSESMDGQHLEEVKTTLILFIKSLPFGCKFNIIGFGSTFSPLFPSKPVAYTEKNVATAVKYALQMRADMGGTDVLEPLKFIYRQQKSKRAKKARRHYLHRYQKNEFIFLLIDGDVANTSEVLALAANNAGTSRFFTLGIGDVASRVLVNGLAHVTGGISAYVREANERIAERVISLLKTACSPTASNVKLEWSFSNHRIARMMPERLPNRAYDGCPIIQYTLVENQPGNTVDGSAVVTADINDAPFNLQINFVCPSTALSPPDDTMPMHRLAAKARLVELSNEALCSGLMIETLRKEAVAVSVSTGIVCDFTALIAVDANTGMPFKKNSPIFAIPESKVGYYVDDDGIAYHFGREPTKAGNTTLRVKEALSIFACKCTANSTEDDFGNMGGRKGTMEYLIITQRLDGSWKLTMKFTKFFGKNAPAINSIGDLRQHCIGNFAKVKPPLVLPNGISDDFIATSLAVAILRHQFTTRRREFELIDQKAACFLFNNNSASNQNNNSSKANKKANENTTSFSPSQLTQFINLTVASFQL